jgi:hypothetical protein
VKRGLYILIFAISFFEVDFLFAQDSELDISKKGSKLFTSEQYVPATPLYLQLLALQPRSAEYNYKYGACLLYNSTNRKTAIKYLEFATTKPEVHPDAYYFMGKAYHLNYQFEKAISYYQEYKAKSKKDFNISWEVDRQIQSCKNGLNLLNNVSDIVVFEKKSVLETSFYNAYDLANIGGDILISDSDQSKIDKKKAHRPLIFFPKDVQRVYFGSYGESEDRGTDIYYKEKNANGTWTKPVIVQGGVNSDFDEDYPYMDTKSGYLYFSSKGHNSMGGFDIFKSKYNEATNTFGKPENLDFAVSSTDNDMLYIKDDSGEFAWFASSRQSKDGKMDVYKVKIERVGSPIAAASGSFNSIVRPQNKSFNIEVKEISTNKIIGTYYSDEKGYYLISFPKSGKYEYSVSIFGSPNPFKQIVTVPDNNDVTLLKQQIVHLTKLGQETIEIIQVDDGNVADRSAIMADVMNSKAELNPNSTLFNSTKVAKPIEIESALVQLGLNKMSAAEAINNTTDLIANYKDETIKNQALQQKSLQLIATNSKQIEKLQNELKEDVAKTESGLPATEKATVLKQAAKKVDQISALDTNNNELLQYANTLQKSMDALTISQTDLSALENKLQKAQAEGDESIFKEIAQNTPLILSIQKESQNIGKDNIQSEIVSLKEAQQKDKDIIKMYKSNVNTLENELKVLKENKATAKPTKANEIQLDIDSKNNELELIQNEIKKNQEKENQKQSQLNAKYAQVSLNRQVSNQVKPTSVQSLAIVQNQVKQQNNQELKTLKAYVNQQTGSSDVADVTKIKTQNELSDLRSKNEIESNTKEKVEEKTTKTFSAETGADKTVKEQVDEEVTLTHKNEIAKIESNVNLSPKQKAEAILKTEKELQKKLDSYLVESQRESSEKPADENAKERYTSLMQEKENSESRVSEQAQILVNSEMEQISSIKLLSKLDSSYAKDIQLIGNSTSKTKSIELIRRENQAQTQLKQRLVVNNNSIKQTNNIELLAENQVINNLIEDSEKRINELQNQLNTEVANRTSTESPTEKVSQRDAFRVRILAENTSLLTSDFSSEIQLNQQRKVMNAYLDALENRLEELRIQDKTNPPPGIQNDLDWTINELETVDKKLVSISKKLNTLDNVANAEVIAEEVRDEQILKPEAKSEAKIVNQADNRGIASPVTSETMQSKDAFRAKILAGNLNLLTDDFNSKTQLTEQEKVMADYLDALESRLVELRVQDKTNSTQALQSDLNWTINELETVEGKLASVSKKLSELNEVANAEVQAREKAQEQIARSEVSAEVKTEPKAINQPENATASSPVPTETVAKKDAFRAQILVGNVQLLTSDFNTENQLTAQEQVMTNYLDALESRLVELRTQDKTNSTPALQSDLNWTINELETVEGKLASVSKKLSELNEVANAEVQAREKAQEQIARSEVSAEVKTEPKAINQPENATASSPVPTETVAKKDAFRAQILVGNVQLLTSDFNTENQLTAQEQVMTNYLDALESRLVELRTQDKTNSTPALQSDLNWTINELETVEGKLASVSKKLIELNEVANAEVQAREIEKEKAEEIAETAVSETSVSNENLVMMNSTTEIQDTKSIKTVQQLNRENQQAAAVLKLSPTFANNNVLSSIEIKNNKLTQEASDIAKIKNEELKIKMMTKLYQEQLVVKEQLAELERDNSYSELTQSAKNSVNLNVSELETTSKLETKQRRFFIEIGELTSSVEQLEADISTLNKRKAKPLVLELSQKQDLLVTTKSALIEVENELNIRKAKMPELVNSSAALKQQISLATENKIARSSEYKDILTDYKEIVEVNEQIRSVQAKVESKRKEIEAVITKSQVSELRLPLAFVEQKMTEMITLNESIPAIEEKRDALQESFNQKIDSTENSELVQNLLVRGVAPITETKPKLLAFKEFKIIPQQEKVARQTIVMNEAKTSGLIYRVQVGAFLKPINENLFTEFTPVSGEKLASGITRYMVGYFNRRDALQTALEKIKKIGYTDAFPVAYCDGERISIIEARRLEDAGLCIPQIISPLNDELIESEEAPLANQTNTNISIVDVEQDKSDERKVLQPAAKEKLAAYNKAPGAAIADAVETRLGLFFTVQVGVFNKPVPSSQLFDIEPLITQRLENGQVRYSTGVFHTIAESKPKKEEAILLGITDAFVTAYYEGARISIQEAMELLKVKDKSILEPVKVVENKILTEEQLLVVEKKKIEEDEIKIEKVKDNLENSNAKIQLVSKKVFETFPLDEIKRYNQKGEFYYDIQDKRVKSIIYSVPDMPSVYGFRNEMDTLLIRKKTRQEASEELTLTVEFKQTSLPGNIGDWLLRFGYLREMKVVNDRIQLTVFGITDPLDYEFVLSDLVSLGFVLVPKNKE